MQCKRMVASAVAWDGGGDDAGAGDESGVVVAVDEGVVGVAFALVYVIVVAAALSCLKHCHCVDRYTY